MELGPSSSSLRFRTSPMLKDVRPRVWRSFPRSKSCETPSRFLHLRRRQNCDCAASDMMKFMENHSVDDGDKFIADLMRESSNYRTLALRILEVRSAYCKNDFEWDNLQRLASEMVEERNKKVMRDYLSETTSSVETESESESEK